MTQTRGFTLIETVVVLAVVALLAAILTPVIIRSIEDAKITRTTNELQVIGAGIASFFKDTGRWPTANGTDLDNKIRLLYGPGDVPITNTTAADSQYWLSTGGWAVEYVDTFQHQLATNDPGGGAINYPDDSTLPLPEYRWRGPYLTDTKADPWGNQYSCNIRYTYETTTNFVAAWSAGPNRTADTSAIQPLTTTITIGEDDIVCRLK